jgi:uncharacterized alpha-E superfamily protein
MLSRKAESLYWIGRYLERAEATARRFDVEYHSRLESESARTATLPWHALLFSSGDETAYRERMESRGQSDPQMTQRDADGRERPPFPFSPSTTSASSADDTAGRNRSHSQSTIGEHSLISFLILDRQNPNSVCACVAAARENARGIRELISSEMWEHLNRFHLELSEETLESVLSRTPHDLLQWVKHFCWLFDGITERTMIRGEGWQFLQCGKYLERAESTARLLDGKSYAMVDADAAVAGALDLHQWTALLKSVGDYEAFRKTHGSMSPADIMAYVLLDARFPGAVCYSIAQVDAALRSVSGRDDGDANEAVRGAGWLLANLIHARPGETVASLHAYLTGLVEDCGVLHGAIVRTFFSHLAWRPWEAEVADEEGAAPGDWHALVLSSHQQ